jgi:anaerobic magnesium-protoporphyrin IX monomethyl ester cyclase
MNSNIVGCCDTLLVGYEDDENLGLRSIAAFMRKSGVQVDIEPYKDSLKERVLESILEKKPKIVGFSIIFQRMLPDFAELMSFLRSNGVQAHFTVGGHFPTLDFQSTLKNIPEIDTVIRHEGEETLLELYKNLDKHDKWPQIKGLVYRQNGEIKVNPPRPLIEDLDSLRFPLRSSKLKTHRGIGVCSIISSRGCYSNCAFCSVQEFYKGSPGTKRRSRSPLNVVQEIEELYGQGIRYFSFKDDDLGTKNSPQKKWIEDFCQEIRNKGLADKILWRISTRVDEVDADLFSKLKEVGLGFLYLGIESGSDQDLKIYNKGYKTEDIRKALDILKKLKINFEYGFMIFNPYSTFDTIKQDLNFLGELCGEGDVEIRLTKMFPYVGTSIAKKLKDEGRLIGTIASPDYRYLDSRINLFEAFTAKTFHNLLFKDDGLSNKIQSAKFDYVMLDKFFPDKYDTKAYGNSIKKLTNKSNDSALETFHMAVEFMEDRSYEDILDGWDMLEMLAQQELDFQSEIEEELDQLVLTFQ